MEDYRRVPIEVLRDFAATRSSLTSLRRCADAAGTFHKIVTAGTMPHPRIRRLLGLWYLRGQGQAADIEVVRPYLALLDTLLTWRRRSASQRRKR